MTASKDIMFCSLPERYMSKLLPPSSDQRMEEAVSSEVNI
jgi:hypothetical protein